MTGGLAHVCLVTSHMTVTRARIEMNIPRKRAGSSDHQKAMTRFYEAVYQVRSSSSIGILHHVYIMSILCSFIDSRCNCLGTTAVVLERIVDQE